MEHHAGLDVSLEETSVCIVDGAGKIIWETQVAFEPEALVGYFSALEIKVVCIGLEVEGCPSLASRGPHKFIERASTRDAKTSLCALGSQSYRASRS